MYLFSFFIVIVIHSAVCTFPDYIHHCSLPNPNAKNCILNSVRFAFPHLFVGDPSLNLVSFAPFDFKNEILFLQPNVEIVLNGDSYPSNDSNVFSARIDLDKKLWEIDFRGSTIKVVLNLSVTIREPYEVIQAKGLTIIDFGLDQWKLFYTGYYETHNIKNKNYMQIYYSQSDFTYDKYKQTYYNLTTMNGGPLTDLNLAKVIHYLKNFECNMNQRCTYLANVGIHQAFNTILKLDIETNIFKDTDNDSKQ